MQSIVAIVQARMGSTRLPGKVLMDLEGSPMLAWVVQRVGRASSVSQVVVATTVESEDDEIEELCESRGWTVFRGSAPDVLDRYYGACRAHPAEAFVRITADCPLIDPGIVDLVVAELTRAPRADYASNTLEPRTFPRGLDVEAFTFEALERAWHRDDSSWREHVTPYLYRNSAEFSIRAVRNDRDLSHMRWTVDTAADLEFVRALALRAGDMTADWESLLRIVEENPDLARINADVRQKALD